MRQIAGIGFLVSIPVDAMKRRIIELVFYLTPYMVEYVFAFLQRTIREFSLERDILGFAIFDLYLFQLATRYEEKVFTLLIGKHSASADFFDQ